jgi:30S ribosomal protein S31
MGKGDKKTRRGKIFSGTYGVRRLRKKNKDSIPFSKKPTGKEVVKHEDKVKEAAEKKIEVKKDVAKENQKVTPTPKKTEKAEKPGQLEEKEDQGKKSKKHPGDTDKTILEEKKATGKEGQVKKAVEQTKEPKPGSPGDKPVQSEKQDNGEMPGDNTPGKPDK